MSCTLDQVILEKDIRILNSLSYGSFGEVKLACHLSTNTQVAVKVLDKNHNVVTDINTEVEILQSLEHRNIVPFFHVIDTLKMTYVVMLYVAGKDLAMSLRDTGYLKEDDARTYSNRSCQQCTFSIKDTLHIMILNWRIS